MDSIPFFFFLSIFLSCYSEEEYTSETCYRNSSNKSITMDVSSIHYPLGLFIPPVKNKMLKIKLLYVYSYFIAIKKPFCFSENR